MAGHPLRPATRRRLGTPLPHQQADRPRTHPRPETHLTARNLSVPQEASRNAHPVLSSVSRGYPEAEGRLLTCYSPVRRSTIHPKVDASLDLHVLSTPPAFVLSQDQTLQQGKKNPAKNPTPHNHAEPGTKKHTQKKGAIKHSHRHAVEFSKNTPTPATRHTTDPPERHQSNCENQANRTLQPHPNRGPPQRTPPAEPPDPTASIIPPQPTGTTTNVDRSENQL